MFLEGKPMETFIECIGTILGAGFCSFLVYLYMLIFFRLFGTEIDVTDKKFTRAFLTGTTILILIIYIYERVH